ncbi:hypothetical protein [Vibrio natriegens]|uniref:hypothetical protein n=1 Tax=Vibrio natriegens TaxID=691 RepID=UPI001EFED712|nr:hypothetical protein [Vibrio natriegens]
MASQYSAYPVSSVANAHHIGQHAIVKMETGLGSGHWQLKQTEEMMMEWSIADVFQIRGFWIAMKNKFSL